MRGCNNFCSYCVVPYLRGRERSRDHHDIAREINSLTSQGVKDITLLGQNVNSYSDGELDFPGLLTRLCELTEIARLRFTTSHPKDVTTELLGVMASQPRVCNWLHLPVQSGSNRILRLMNRDYNREHYLELVSSARDSIPELSITTDIMVGFPSESEDEFLETLDLVERVRFDFAYMFMYSTREGTKAAELESLPIDVEKKRLERLIDLQNSVTRAKNELLVGTEVEILVEGECKKGDYSGYGKTRNNKVVLVNEPVHTGELVQVKVLGLSGWTPWGERVNG
jgi:tRNA-2-methylthio-N6-dimethylallyladenosine synthase